MGFVIVAKAKRGLFVACEVAWGVVSIALAWACIAYFGLEGAGIAYFGSYVFHALMLYVIVSRLSGFRASRDNCITGLISLSLTAIVFFGLLFLPITYSVAIGIAATIFHSVYSVQRLSSFLTPEQIPGPIRQLFLAVGLIARNKQGIAEVS
jgi:PST family polysaccharide transporter